MELLHENSLWPQQVDYICKKGPAAGVWLDSKDTLDWRVVIFFFFRGLETSVFSDI